VASYYHIHKRRTLDRLTLRYQLQLRAVLRENAQGMVGAMQAALEQGRESWEPSDGLLVRLPGRIELVFNRHQDHVIRTAISDGIQEVSPKNELALWTQHPLDVPVEETIGVALADDRDKAVDRFKALHLRSLSEDLKEFVKSAFDAHLKNIRKAYARASSEWLAGDGSRRLVTDAIRDALVSTDAHAERIFRTETTTYFNQARQEYFATDTAVDYMMLSAITDGRISKICDSRNGFVVPIERARVKKYMPAFHPHCRTIQRPLISALPSHKVLVDRGVAMNESRFYPLPKGWA
jgi:SPP1 gp7 family putative phage head morphogenesis protein